MKTQLKNLVNEFIASIEEARRTYPNISPMIIRQKPDELTMVISYLYPRKFKNFTEIGCAEGGSLWVYSNMLCSPNAFIRAIDIKLPPNLIFTCEKLKKSGKEIEIIQKDSREAFRDILDNSIDLLHIDADHSAETVNKDWELYYPKVSKNGIILLHDTIRTEGPKLLKERLEREKYNIVTFHIEENSLGISVIKK